MTELLTAAQMRTIEQAAIDSGDVTGLELMERAGRGVVDAIFEEWPELAKTDHRAVVLCGPGNNGGDGFVVARLLKEWGWEVEVFLYGDPKKLPTDARVNYERWGAMGKVQPCTSELKPSADDDVDLIVDALFGTGLTRPIENIDLTLLDICKVRAIGSTCSTDFRKGAAARVVSVDLPSGVCSDSGFVVGSESYRGLPDVAVASSVSADLTVTFHRIKLGHVLAEGAWAGGHIVVKDIGLEKNACNDQAPGETVRTVGPRHFERLVKRLADHKYTHGHALILSGGVGKGGAARMAARGALRIGAGVVTVGCPPSALQENAGALDAVMVRSLKGGDGLAEALQDKRINALCIGPGLGVERAAEMLDVALGEGGQIAHPTVIDADGLTALAGDDGVFGKLHENCVLTPHAGEFARMFPDIAAKLNAPATKGPAYSKVDATREAAARAGCVVLFKGADTVIADAQGRCSISSAHYERSAPWLATAGSGDVLAGFITGLLARGFAPLQAAKTGAWLHVECALKFGPGLIAEDLPEQLPAVFRDLGV